MAPFEGFVDGTFQGFCCPQDYDRQHAVYSGHAKAHGQKWQAIIGPDSLVWSLTGPWVGPVNDWKMWKVSGMERCFRTLMEGHQTLLVYGNPAYRVSYGVLSPWTHPLGRHALPADQKAFNQRLSAVHIAVEHAFGHTQVLWTYTAFSKGLKADWQPVAAYFAVAVLLMNCYTCLCGNQTSRRFITPPPTVEEYLNCSI